MLEPIDQEKPAFVVFDHPVCHQGHSECDFNNPVDDDLHPLVEPGLIVNNPEKVSQKFTYRLRVKILGVGLASFNKVLEKDEEWSDFVIIVLFQATCDNVIDVANVIRFIVTIVHVSLGERN